MALSLGTIGYLQTPYMFTYLSSIFSFCFDNFVHNEICILGSFRTPCEILAVLYDHECSVLSLILHLNFLYRLMSSAIWNLCSERSDVPIIGRLRCFHEYAYAQLRKCSEFCYESTRQTSKCCLVEMFIMSRWTDMLQHSSKCWQFIACPTSMVVCLFENIMSGLYSTMVQSGLHMMALTLQINAQIAFEELRVDHLVSTYCLDPSRPLCSGIHLFVIMGSGSKGKGNYNGSLNNNWQGPYGNGNDGSYGKGGWQNRPSGKPSSTFGGLASSFQGLRPEIQELGQMSQLGSPPMELHEFEIQNHENRTRLMI